MAASRMVGRLLLVNSTLFRSSWNSTGTSQVQSLSKRRSTTTGIFKSCSRGFCGLQSMVNTPVMKSNLQLTPASSQYMNIQSSTFSTFKNQIKPKGMSSQIGSFASGVRCLPTLNQVRRQKPRTKKVQPKPYIPKSERVLLGPQRKGVCIKVFIRKPKKPNSAQRKCALLKLSNGKTISAYIPHEKGQLQEHGVVLFEGGRVQDCPGIKYKIIRGKLDMN